MKLKQEKMHKIPKTTQKILLQIARAAIAAKLNIEFENPLINPLIAKNFDKETQKILNSNRGVFVSLHIGRELRGCIGVIETREPLKTTLPEHAVYAAFDDPRFNPLTADEFNKIKIEISLLSPPKPLKYKNVDDLLKKLIPLKHGVVIKKGFSKATFLPQVWDDLRRKEDFLSHLCAKAWLDGNEWKNGELEVRTYEAEVFSE